MSKNSTKTFRSKSSDHVPVVPTMVSTNTVGVKKIHVFRNGDAFFPGIQVVVNTHRTPNVNVLLDVISDKIGLINGAKKLYSTSGVLIKDINKIKDNQNYVASSSHFTPMAYGGEKVAKTKKRSKSTKSKERKHNDGEGKKHHNITVIHPSIEEEIAIPLNHEVEKTKKKKKKIVRKLKKEEEATEHGDTKIINIRRRHSLESTNETAEVELPSEVEDSDNDYEDKRRGSHPATGRLESRDHEREERHGTRHEHRRDSLKSHRERLKSEDEHENEHEQEEHSTKTKTKEKRRKSVAKKKSQPPNWGDLSSFTQNIESLLKK